MRLNYEKFLKSGVHADVEFVVKSEKFDISKTFKAHKLLLALSSEVFEAMFYGQLAEKDTVVITDLHPDGFYGLLKYVYAGEARIENCYEALHTKAAAEKYLFEDLATSCLAYLRKQVDYKEACLVLDYGFESGYGSLDKVAEAVLFNKEVPLPRPSVFGIKKRPTFSIGLHDYVGRPNGLLNFLEIVGGLTLYASISASPGDSKAVRLLSSSAFTFSFNSVCMLVASMASPQCAYYLPRTFYYVVFQGLGAFCYLIGTFFTMQDSQQVPAHLMIGYCVGGLHALHCGYACYKVYIQKGRSGWL